MTRMDVARQMFRNVATALLVVAYAACLAHGYVSCEFSGIIGTVQCIIVVLVALPAIFFRCWGILSAAAFAFLIFPMFVH